MDAEKNVVEAARAVVATRGWDLLGGSHEKIVALRAALSAYDSAPAPSEDRVREAAEAAARAWLGVDARTKIAAWSDRIDDVANALRPYVTPAPALPEGTVAVEVSLLKRWRVAMSRCIATNGSPTHNLSLPEIDAILPPPKPEPPKELVRKWELEAEKWAASRFLENPLSARIGYVAALRAAWEDNPERKP